MNESRDNELARKRAAVIFAVRSGRITAEEGAKTARRVQEDLLRAGAPGAPGHDRGTGERSLRQAGHAAG